MIPLGLERSGESFKTGSQRILIWMDNVFLLLFSFFYIFFYYKHNGMDG
jgi:hypothetical protein